jgi:hypothetical protein
MVNVEVMDPHKFAEFHTYQGRCVEDDVAFDGKVVYCNPDSW